MKKTFIAALLSVMLLGSVVKAEEVSSYKDIAGITPDSILYPLDKGIDALKVALSMAEESKAKLLAKIAEERLGESQLMTDKNKVELAEKALKEYEEKIQQAQVKLEKLIETVNAEEGDKKIDKIKDAEENILKKTENSIEVLKKLQEKLPEEAKENIARVIEMQTAKKEAVIAMVEKRHEVNQVRKDLNEAKVALQKLEKTGDEEAINKAKSALEEAQKQYDAKKEELKQAIDEKKKVVKEAYDEEKKIEATKKAEEKKIEEEKKKEESLKKEENKKLEEEKKKEEAIKKEENKRLEEEKKKQEENKKQEEKEQKEKEKQAEKDQKEQQKQAEKEQKEKEKQEQKDKVQGPKEKDPKEKGKN